MSRQAWAVVLALQLGLVGPAIGSGFVYRAPDGTIEYTDHEKSDPAYQLVRRVDLDDRSNLTIVNNLPSWVKRPALYRPYRPSLNPGNRIAYTSPLRPMRPESPEPLERPPLRPPVRPRPPPPRP